MPHLTDSLFILLLMAPSTCLEGGGFYYFTGAACTLSCAPVVLFTRGCVCAVAILTVKILAMAEHMKIHRKDFSSRLCAPARCSTFTIHSEQ